MSNLINPAHQSVWSATVRRDVFVCCCCCCCGCLILTCFHFCSTEKTKKPSGSRPTICEGKFRAHVMSFCSTSGHERITSPTWRIQLCARACQDDPRVSDPRQELRLAAAGVRNTTPRPSRDGSLLPLLTRVPLIYVIQTWRDVTHLCDAKARTRRQQREQQLYPRAHVAAQPRASSTDRAFMEARGSLFSSAGRAASRGSGYLRGCAADVRR